MPCFRLILVLGGSLQSLDLALSYYIQFSLAFTAHKRYANKDIPSYHSFYHILLQHQVLVDTKLKGKVNILTPRNPSERGAQLSLVFPAPADVMEVHKRVSQHGVICDVRQPDVMRIAPAPLYNSYSDVLTFIKLLQKELE